MFFASHMTYMLPFGNQNVGVCRHNRNGLESNSEIVLLKFIFAALPSSFPCRKCIRAYWIASIHVQNSLSSNRWDKQIFAFYVFKCAFNSIDWIEKRRTMISYEMKKKICEWKTTHFTCRDGDSSIGCKRNLFKAC